MSRAAILLGAALTYAAVAVPDTVPAPDISPPASEWRSYCQVYLKALDGSTDASDLEITYCLGVTKGLLTGLRVGSTVGALSFGATIAGRYQLDPDEVFKLFQTQESARLLGICSPPSMGAPDYVRVVLDYLEKHPGDLQRPIAEVFYDGLADTYPCF